MSYIFPEVLQGMLKQAADTLAAGDAEKAEAEYLLAVDYSSKVYQASSACTGLVLLKLLQFYEARGLTSKAAITMARLNTISAAYAASRAAGA